MHLPKTKVVWVLTPCQSPYFINSVKPMTNSNSAGDGVSLSLTYTLFLLFEFYMERKSLIDQVRAFISDLWQPGPVSAAWALTTTLSMLVQE